MSRACRVALPALLLAGVFLLALPAGRALSQEAKAEYVGEKTCLQCHTIEEKHFGHSLHAKVFRLNPKNDLEARVCEACHGPGSRHVSAPTEKRNIVRFTRDSETPLEEQNAQCLTCHKGGQRLHWPGSIHATNQLGCGDCHNPMARLSANSLLKKTSIAETCYTCHQQQRAEFKRRSHMPVPEGKMSCADCHNPHGSGTKPLLKANSINETCYACHAEKRGPFNWEHAPVRESCSNCHHPHGSNHDKLLVAARPYLCQQCHGNTFHPSAFYGAYQTGNNVFGQPGVALNSRVMGRSCLTCHAQVHGSNHPAGARFQR
jgi:DmsE family decaheme c-type cytochrome